MPTAAKTQAAQAEKTPEWNAERLDELDARVTRLEEQLGGVLTGKVAEFSQEEKDRETLSRRPNSYAEAVEFEAAQKRQAERDEKDGKGTDGPDEG